MRVNVFVDGVQVGIRDGCDVLVGEDSCKKASVGSPFFYENMPRDICEACMIQMAPGKPLLKFKTSHYDSINEKFSTKTNSAAEKIPEAPSEPEAPKFPTCPYCGERSFSISQVLVESKQYDWDAPTVSFKFVGEPGVDQKVLYHCKKCSKEVPSELLSSWIS